MTRIAHEYRLPVSAVYDWSHTDLVAAVASVAAAAERCPGCGLTEPDAWWVTAEMVRCPTCEDRDRLSESLRKQEGASLAGVRVRFDTLTSHDESMEHSSAARYTQAGAEARARWRQERRV